jgi:hypothetical protein
MISVCFPIPLGRRGPCKNTLMKVLIGFSGAIFCSFESVFYQSRGLQNDIEVLYTLCKCYDTGVSSTPTYTPVLRGCVFLAIVERLSLGLSFFIGSIILAPDHHVTKTRMGRAENKQ